ncbi:MAG: FtsK/SpoIIIE domain-containing protein [Candidatus Nanoarchaeia archaeon]|jgi:hypothetical protein|nr:FtsK/SpoIIIE domain-containing protein [Candidatus Nanoarchaeia archaeon]
MAIGVGVGDIVSNKGERVQINEMMNKLKADKVLVEEIKCLVGRHVDPNVIFELENQLKYKEVEESLEGVQRSGSFVLVASKLARVRSDIKKIRSIDYSVCEYLTSLNVGWRKSSRDVKKDVDVLRRVDYDFSCVDIFDVIRDEKLPVVLGSERVIDLVKMPHLLVAGSTGSGKSVFLNLAIMSILSSVSDVQLALIDPKRVEFSLYKGLSNLFMPVATKYEQADMMLEELILEMERRYLLLEKAGVKSVCDYNKRSKEKISYIVVVIDELADLMLVSDHGLEVKITRLVQLARAAGIHLIMATQRPVAEIMTGLIKANMPARIAFRVESKQDSRIILDESGAETLKGAGEMIFKSFGQVEKQQGLYLTDDQIKKILRIK